MGTLLNDVRYGLRMLAKSPGFTAVAVLTLALGIGANTAIFTLINALMLRSLPVERPQELFFLGDEEGSGTYSGGIPTGSWKEFSYRVYQQLREQNQLFTDLCALSSPQVDLRVAAPGWHESAPSAQGSLVSGNYFQVLGVHALAGRTLIPEDDAPGSPRSVAVMSHRYWTDTFGGDPSVVGKALDLNGIPFMVVGVAPAEFYGVKLTMNPPDFWVPLGLQPQLIPARQQWRGAPPSWLKADDVYWLDLMGRLKPGVDARQAAAALTTHLRQMLTAQAGSHLSPNTSRRIRESYIELIPGARGLSSLRERFSERLHTLTLLVILVLVIACANAANLLLARGARRQREMAVRLAVGAGRGRVVRQLLTESALLAGMGGLAGLLLAGWTTDLLANLVFGASTALPFHLAPDGRVLGFTVGVSLLTGIVFGLAPAWVSTRLDLNSALKESAGSTPVAGLRLSPWAPGKLLASGQVAVSLCLVLVAGLFVRSLQNLEHQDLGFNPGHVLVCNLDLDAAGYKRERLPGLYPRLLDRVRALPGVRAATLASSALTEGTWVSNISIEAYTPKPQEDMDAHRRGVGSDYFLTEGMMLLAGRPIGPEDTAASPPVAVVNETFVRRYFPNQNPLGRHITFGAPFAPPGMEIVGVVKDAKYNSLAEKVPPVVFAPLMQSIEHVPDANDLELRVAGDPAAAAAAVRRAVAEVDRKIMIGRVATLGELVSQSAHEARLIAQLSSFFGLLALLLAAIGLYGVMAYAVARRTSEIGIRMALGAEARAVLWMVMRESLLVVVVGIAVGVPAALGLARVVRSQLFGLSPSDPTTLAAATLLLLAASVLAGLLPARRAAKVDPMVALRYE